MTNDNYDYEAVKSLIEDDTNVTDTNLLKDLFQIVCKLMLILVSVYLFVFVCSGIVIKSLSIEKQIALENYLSEGVDVKSAVKYREDIPKLDEIRNRILLVDDNFPKTSNLKIDIIEEKSKNALCYPNGNIYITSALYERLKDEEMLTFVIAHEMAHYKNRDHLMQLRQNIAGGFVVIAMSAVSPSASENSELVESIISLTDLKFSRGVEAKADVYAGDILLKLYGNSNGGVRALESLQEDEFGVLEFASTHPDIVKRIEKLKKLK